MFDNLHIELHERRSSWRRWAAGTVAIVGVVFFVFSRLKIPVALVDTSAVFRALASPRGRAAAVGGDVTVEPPQSFPSALTDRGRGRPVPPTLAGTAPLPSFSASAVLVADASSAAVLLETGEKAPRPIASITKLMSALVLLERDPDWPATTTVPGDEVEDTHMYAGDTYSLGDLWHAALVGSSNKAMLAMVDALGFGREEFVARMNDRARELGMTSTTFADPTGLDERNVTTPKGASALLRAAIENETIRSALQTRGYDLYSPERKKPHHMWNTNWLLLGWITNSFSSIHGGKTGFLPDSGYNVAVSVSDEKGHVVDVVVLGAPGNEARFIDARVAAEWVYTNYEWP